MKFKLSVVSLAVASMSSSAMAFDFGVTAANDAQAKSANWKCAQCAPKQALIGKVEIEAGNVNHDDSHAVNTLKYKDGAAAGINANLVVNKQGYRTQLETDALGSEQAQASIKTGYVGRWSVEAHVDDKQKNSADNAQSHWHSQNGDFIHSEEPLAQSLALNRKKYQLGANFQQHNYGSYVTYSTEDKTGKQLSSVSNGHIIAMNLAAPVDTRTQNLSAGLSVKGDNWFSEINYQGSWFANNIDSLTLADSEYLSVSQPADNQSHFVSMLGHYRFTDTYVSGRVVTGNMVQKSELITFSGSAENSAQAHVEVDTLDANLKLSTTAVAGLRITGAIDYAERDNRSDINQYEQFRFNSLTAELVENRTYDTTRAAYKLSGSYPLAKGQKLDAGIERVDTKRTEQDRENTHDNLLWAQWRTSAWSKWDIRLKASYGDKGGSAFLYDDAAATNEGELMRKYYLADKKTTRADIFTTHMPIDSLSINMQAHYAIDDYTNTQVGLVESIDYGVQAGLNWQTNDDVSINVDGGYQWIDNQQASARNNYASYWQADTAEEFGFAGLGFTYTGLSDFGLTIGGDYHYALSFSDSQTEGQDIFGLYESSSHHATLYANYGLSSTMTLGLRYEVERYKSADDTQLPTEYYPGSGPTGLTTLGELNHDYTAHLVMASFRYQF
ncbi:MtrB/PioB family decaheme-associated outer membrane protein [Shewanella intestini]|uniref:MtrB/PioB family decaheme-associated outer membrane protein n=1 Tax=Shewanella intestini TaxID=2017544 RepID=A0ABS5I1P4_9GAMM|nr:MULTISPECIES: MtrB/PioB family decaheme-associated outer membrane protein [Shewanella]MBR9727939.1 MtrB/PioB family decaheme-associated outer membrane protein [Shewanella intestini]MRG36510.1 MtrB/PioB family decaheme-associated outer membrane protein [Shewanella sp. XMDDZSB0408]